MPHSNALEKLARQYRRDYLDVLEMFLERSAIREYEDGQSRGEAESGALEDVRTWLEACRG